jgi:hypothetical protein
MTNRPSDREEKVIFAFAPASSQPDHIPTLTFMMPEKSRHYMRNGMCHEFNLTNVGIPLRIIIGGCDDHAHGMAILQQANGGPLNKFKDVRDVDMHMDEPDRKPEQ